MRRLALKVPAVPYCAVNGEWLSNHNTILYRNSTGTARHCAAQETAYRSVWEFEDLIDLFVVSTSKDEYIDE